MFNYLVFLVSFIACLYLTYKINNCKINLVNGFILSFIMSSILFLLKSNNIKQIYIVLIYYIFQIILIKLCSKIKFVYIIINTSIIYILNTISELIIIFIVTLITKNNSINLTYSIFIPVFSTLLINIKQIKNVLQTVINNNKNIIYILIIFLIFSIYFLVNSIYSKEYIIIIFVSILTLTCIILIANIIIKSEKVKLYNKEYNNTLKLINEYEIILNDKIKMTHEFKNQLIMIKSMINDKDKNTKKYINELLNDNVSKINDKIASELQKSPIKVLNGVLYYKISSAENKSISINLDIDNKIRKFKSINSNDINDICKLFGIYMDNAVENCIENDKKIDISVHTKENKLIISIANSFDGIIITSKSKKGKYHGYGLNIANDILLKNNNIKCKKSYIGNIYIQDIIYEKSK